MDNLLTNSTVDALQLYYTSCENGVEGSSGFQVQAISDGIEFTEREELKKLGAYEPPRDLPSAPSKEDIARLFPVAFRNVKLHSGKWAMTRSEYTGLDFSGMRYGNFFTHGLLLDSMGHDIWPVDIYGWEGWCNSYVEGQHALSRISIIPDKERYSLQELERFLNKNKDRILLIQMMIVAIFLGKETSRKLVIKEDEIDNGLLWIACIQKSFPAHMQDSLSCSSYQFHPGTCLDVNVIYGENDFRLDETEKEYQFYVVDLVDNQHSKIDGNDNYYAITISKMLYQNPEKLNAFHLFSSFFTYSEIGEHLSSMLKVFQFIEGEINVFEKDSDFNRILKFISEYTKKEKIDYILTSLAPAVNKMIACGNYENTEQFIYFYMDFFNATGDKAYKGIVLEQLFGLFNAVYFEKKYSENNFLVIEEKVRSNLRQYDQDFSNFFLLTENIERFKNEISTLNGEETFIVLARIFKAMRLFEPDTPLSESDNAIELILLSVQAQKEMLYKFPWKVIDLFDSHEEKVNIVYTIFQEMKEITENKEITSFDLALAVQSLADYMQTLFSVETNRYYDFINTLCGYEICWDLVYEEWKSRILRHHKKLYLFTEYQINVLDSNSDYREKYQTLMKEEYWKSLSDIEKNDQAVSWITMDEIKYMSEDSFFNELFYRANQKIKFERDGRESLELVKKMQECNIQNILFEPNKLVLFDALFGEENIINNSEISKALKNIDENDYRVFIGLYLPNAMENMGKYESHGDIIKALFLPRYKKYFIEAYCSMFEQNGVKELSQTESIAWRFWVSITTRDENYKIYKYIHKEIFECLGTRFSILPDKQYKSIKDAEGLSRSQKIKLNDILEIASSKKKSLFNSISKSLKKFPFFGKTTKGKR